MPKRRSRPSRSTQPVSVVTGGAGFLGSHLVDLLLARGHRVIAIDNFITGSVANIDHLAGNTRFRFIQQDVTEFIFLKGPVDYVWHFASPASPVDYIENWSLWLDVKILLFTVMAVFRFMQRSDGTVPTTTPSP